MSTIPFVVELLQTERIDADLLPLWHEGMSDPAIVRNVARRREWLYRTRNEGITATWVVRDGASAEVLGACSAIPCDLTVLGTPRRAGHLVDFIVGMKARAAGPALALQRDLAEQSRGQGFDLLYGAPNRRAWPIFARLGYTAVCQLTTWARPLARDVQRMRRVMGSRLAGKLGPRWGPRVTRLLAPLAALSADAALQLGENLARAYAAALGYRTTIGAMHREPHAIADGEEQVALSTRGNPGYLAWRYVDHPTHNYLLCEVRRRAKPVAWAVLRPIGSMAEVQDAAWSRAEPGLRWLWWWLLAARARRHGIDLLSVSWAGNQGLVDPLRAAGFVVRPEQRRFIVHLPADADQALRSVVSNPANWRLFAGELDI